MNGTILLVDDDRTIRQYCKTALEAEGYFVLLAHDGEDAMFVCSQIQPDLVVTDVHMRSCGGLELARCLKNTFPEVLVVFHTSDADWQYHGLADGCVQKSEDLGSLKDTIWRCISAGRQNSARHTRSRVV